MAAALEAEATHELAGIDEGIGGLVNALEDMLTATSHQRRMETSTLRALPDIFMFGGLLTLLFASFVTILQLFKPLGKLQRAMMLASGDAAAARDYTLKVERQDEIGLATISLNSLLHSVSDGIERISSAEKRLRDTGHHLQAIMDNVADGIITLDADGVIETFSPSAEKIFRRRADDIIGHQIDTLLQDSGGHPCDLMARLSAQGGEFFGSAPAELMTHTGDGTAVPLEMAIGRADFSGRTVYVVTLRDITARKQLESFMERAQRMELIGRMTGGIAHDFNNMLTVISGNFELISLKLKTADPILKSMVAMGLDTVKRGKDMTQRLLAVSSKQLLKPETLDLSERLPAIGAMIRACRTGRCQDRNAHRAGSLACPRRSGTVRKRPAQPRHQRPRCHAGPGRQQAVHRGEERFHRRGCQVRSRQHRSRRLRDDHGARQTAAAFPPP